MTTANSWPHSRTVCLDNNGDPCPGALAYFYDGGTTTPRTSYTDSGLATAHPYPVVADANGRWPRVFLQFGDYDEKVTTAGGTQLWNDPSIGNTDPVDLAVSVDEDAMLSTGDVWWSPLDSTRSGAVRLNGRTIGNAASGASERANADTADLFTFLWNNLADAQAAVSTGRGASAAADYAANKTIALPDLRGAAPLGLDTMGNSAGSFLPAQVPFTHGDATTAGSLLGANTHTLTTAQLAAHLHAVSITTDSQGAHTHTFSASTDTQGSHNHTYSGVTSTEGSHSHTGTTDSGGVDHTHEYVRPTANPFVAWASGTGAESAGVSTTGGASAYLHTHTFTTASAGSHNHTFSGFASTEGAHAHSVSGTTASNGAHTHTVSGNTASTGSDAAHNNVPRAVLGTWFIKL